MDNRTKGIIFLLLSSLSFAIMSAIVKNIDCIPTYEKVFFRNLLGVFILGSVMFKKKLPFWGKRENLKYLLARSFFGFLGVLALFYSISNMKYIADATLLSRLSVFFVMILASIFLKEKIYKEQKWALVIAFVGVLLIIKPKFDFDFLPAFFGLIGGFVSGIVYTILRYLNNKEHPATIVFFFSLFSTVASLPLIFITGWVSPGLIGWVSLVGIGLFAFIGQITLTTAYKLAPAGEISIYNYSMVIFSAMFGFIFWEEIPEKYSIIGMILVFVASYYNYLFLKSKKVA